MSKMQIHLSGTRPHKVLNMSLPAFRDKNLAGLAVGTRLQPGYAWFQYPHRLACFNFIPIAEHARFASHLALYIPEAETRIDEGDFGILHLEVGALKLETRDAIARRNWNAVRNHFIFISMTMEDGAAELRYAIRISYLGSLFYGEVSLNHAKARSLLPRNLAAALAAVEEHYERLAS